MDRKTVESIAKTSLLFDFYGGLLTDRQREVMEYYHEENLSLAEIADKYGISRQAVHDTLKKAETALAGYEETLGLVDKLMKSRQAIEEIDEKIDELVAHTEDADAVKKLEEIKMIINKLEE